MAAAFVRSLGTASGSSSTQTITLTSATTAGHTILIGCKGGSGHHATGASDSKSNTYTLDWAGTTSTAATVSVLRAYLTTALGVGTTITVTFSANGTTTVPNTAAALEYSGVTKTSPVTNSAGKHITSGTSITITSLTPSKSSDLWYSVWSKNANTQTPTVTSTFTTRYTFAVHRSLAIADYVSSNSNAHSITWSSGSATNSSAVLIAYKTSAVVKTASATLTASGTLSGTGSITREVASATLTATGKLQAPPSPIAQPSASSSLSAVATLVIFTSASLAASATLQGTASEKEFASASTTATGSLLASALLVFSAAASLTATGRLTATTTNEARLASAGTLTATGFVQQIASAGLAGSATLAAAGAVIYVASANLTASSTLTANARSQIASKASISASAALNAVASTYVPASASSASTGILEASFTLVFPAYSHLTASGYVRAVGRLVQVVGFATVTLVAAKAQIDPTSRTSTITVELQAARASSALEIVGG